MASPVPDIMLKSIYEITPEMLQDMGVTLLLMDLDNTLAKYGDEMPSDKLKKWVRTLENDGITPFLYSNNRGKRPEVFASDLNVDFIGHAGKPKTANLQTVLDKCKKKKSETAIVGDQIYTDIMFGSKAGIKTIAVHPINLRNLFRLIRYGLEWPFRNKYEKAQRKKN